MRYDRIVFGVGFAERPLRCGGEDEEEEGVCALLDLNGELERKRDAKDGFEVGFGGRLKEMLRVVLVVCRV